MKKFLAVGGGIIAAALACWLFVEVFAGHLVLSQSFHIGGFGVRYYGLIIGAAVLAGYFTARGNAWRFGLGKEEIDRVAFWTVIVSGLVARGYFVLFELDYFLEHPSEIIQLWDGGWSIYGAILGGLLFVYFWTRKRIYSIRQILDLAALALPLGQAIGRLGNFFNYEAYGRATDLPWKMFVPEQFRVDVSQAYYHPVFLYEALLNLLIFTILLQLRGKVRAGSLAIIYLISYSAVRFCLEPLRVDSVFMADLRVDQMVSVVIFVAAILAFWRTRSQAV